MKKILSLTLVVAMLLSTMLLTSCDVTSLLKNFGFEPIETTSAETTPTETTPAETTPAETTPTETTPEETTPEENTPAEPSRYTITQEEWVAAINSSNFTFTGVISDGEVTQNVVYSITDNSAEMKLDGTVVMYYVCLNNKVYMLAQPDATMDWYAVETEMGRWITVYDVIGVDENTFVEYLKYNEASKSYVYEEDGIKAEFYFEDGKLIKGSIVAQNNYSYLVENVGTTTVTLPEYTIYQPKTTVTKEEFIAGFNPTNFTYTRHARLLDMNGEVLESYTLTTLVDLDTRHYEYRVDDVARQYGFSVGDETYTIMDPHQTGTWYCFKESEPLDWEARLTVQGILYLDDLGALFDGLTYREETKSYFYQESEGNTVEIWYEDNQLVKWELYADGELYSSVDNVGETIVILPDYTMAEN